jgi:hypothetical protein
MRTTSCDENFSFLFFVSTFLQARIYRHLLDAWSAAIVANFHRRDSRLLSAFIGSLMRGEYISRTLVNSSIRPTDQSVGSSPSRARVATSFVGSRLLACQNALVGGGGGGGGSNRSSSINSINNRSNSDRRPPSFELSTI